MADRYLDMQAYDMQLSNGESGDKPCAIVSLRVVDGPETGTNWTWYGNLYGPGLEYTIKGLRALGWTGTKVSKAMSEGLGTLRAQGKISMWKGKERVNGVYPPLSAKKFEPKNPVDAADIEAFDALFESAAEVVECVPATEATKAGALPPSVKRTAAPANPNDLGY